MSRSSVLPTSCSRSGQARMEADAHSLRGHCNHLNGGCDDNTIRDWLPAPLMLFVYWQGGSFKGQPNTKIENTLAAFDMRFTGAVNSVARSQILTVWLETAYLLCYPL